MTASPNREPCLETRVTTELSFQSRMTRALIKYRLMPWLTLGTVLVQRKRMERLALWTGLPSGARVEKTRVQGLGMERVAFFRSDDNPGQAILHIHGGGFRTGSCATHRDLAARLSRASRVPVYVPEYRLAPEHKHPAAPDDCLAAWENLLEKGFNPKNLLIGGDSAGGCLALMLLLSLKKKNAPLPKAAYLISPLSEAAHLRYYSGRPSHPDPLLYPVHADMQGLPPLYIQAGQFDPLVHCARRLAARARACSVDVRLEIWEAMWHVFQYFAFAVPESARAVERIGAFSQHHLALPGKGTKRGEKENETLSIPEQDRSNRAWRRSG